MREARNVKRKLLTFFSALSLLPFVAVCALGAAGTAHDAWWLCWSDGRLLLIGADGRAAVRFAQWFVDPAASRLEPGGGGADDYRGRRALWASLRQGADPIALSGGRPQHVGGAGLDFYVDSDATRPWYHIVSVHGAYVALMALVLPLLAIRRAVRRQHWRRRGACTACGYDLTGNVSGVCPECGTARATA